MLLLLYLCGLGFTGARPTTAREWSRTRSNRTSRAHPTAHIAALVLIRWSGRRERRLPCLRLLLHRIAVAATSIWCIVAIIDFDIAVLFNACQSSVFYGKTALMWRFSSVWWTGCRSTERTTSIRTEGVVATALIIVAAVTAAVYTVAIASFSTTVVSVADTSCRRRCTRWLMRIAIGVLRWRRRQIDRVVVAVSAVSIQRFWTPTSVVLDSACILSSSIQDGRAWIRSWSVSVAVVSRRVLRWWTVKCGDRCHCGWVGIKGKSGAETTKTLVLLRRVEEVQTMGSSRDSVPTMLFKIDERDPHASRHVRHHQHFS